MFSVRMRSERVYHLIKLISLANMAEVISSEVLLLLQQLVAEAETRPSQCHGHITVHLNPPPPPGVVLGVQFESPLTGWMVEAAAAHSNRRAVPHARNLSGTLTSVK